MRGDRTRKAVRVAMASHPSECSSSLLLSGVARRVTYSLQLLEAGQILAAFERGTFEIFHFDVLVVLTRSPTEAAARCKLDNAMSRFGSKISATLSLN